VGETGILSRASEIFGERVEGFHFLEGKRQNRHLLVADIIEDSGAYGIHGLGIAVAEKNLALWAVAAAQIPQEVQGAAI
jgi:hypothetical protein